MSVERAALVKALGVDLPDELLTVALTHRSYSYENGGLPTNERLEFLGDAVLGLTVTDELYHRHPERTEGDLAKLRASIVNTHALADVGRKKKEAQEKLDHCRQLLRSMRLELVRFRTGGLNAQPTGLTMVTQQAQSVVREMSYLSDANAELNAL